MPIARHRNIDVSESSLEKRGILHVDLWDDGRAVEIATLNTHFRLTSRQRRRQWFKLIQSLPADESVPVIACGDFNDWTVDLDTLELNSPCGNPCDLTTADFKLLKILLENPKSQPFLIPPQCFSINS